MEKSKGIFNKTKFLLNYFSTRNTSTKSNPFHNLFPKKKEKKKKHYKTILYK